MEGYQPYGSFEGHGALGGSSNSLIIPCMDDIWCSSGLKPQQHEYQDGFGS